MRGRKPEGLGSADRKPFRGFDSYWTGCASQSEKQLSRAKQSETGGAGVTVVCVPLAFLLDVSCRPIL